MKWIGIPKLFLLGMLVAALGGFQLACSKPESSETKGVVQESHEKEAAPDPKAEKKEEKAEEKADDNDDKKVTNVKEAFQYTGKEMDKGFKKSGKSIKKAFVGDDKD